MGRWRRILRSGSASVCNVGCVKFVRSTILSKVSCRHSVFSDVNDSYFYATYLHTKPNHPLIDLSGTFLYALCAIHDNN